MRESVKDLIRTLALYNLTFAVIAMAIAWPKERDFVCLNVTAVPELAINGHLYWGCTNLHKLPLSTEGIVWPPGMAPR